jgi:exosortase
MSQLLFSQAFFLLEKEHLQFYPIAFAAAIYFLYQEGTIDVRKMRSLTVGTCLGFTAVALTLAALFLHSSWLSHLVLVFSIWAWAIGRFGNLSIFRITGICSLMAITVPAPLGWDHKLVQFLQYFSSTVCSRLMDVAGIIHLKRGNIIELVSKPLFVEEACSGVDSQYALMAVAMVLLLIGRASFLVSLITVLTVPIWAILGNLLRIFSIVIGLDWFGVDLSHGTQHTLLGLLAFMLAAWAHWSSVQLLNFVEICWTIGAKGPGLTWPYLGQASRPPTQISSEVSLARFSPKWCVIPALAVIFLPIDIWSVRQAKRQLMLTSVNQAVASELLVERDLPRRVGSWIMEEFQDVNRDRTDQLGEFSKVWTYRSVKEDSALASFDFPFRGWHPLWECYINAGWTRLDTVVTKVFSEATKQEWPVFQIDMRDQDGHYGTLFFAMFDEKGRPYQFDGSLQHRKDAPRLNRNIFKTIFESVETYKPNEEPLTFQFQILVNSEVPTTSAMAEEYRKLFVDLLGKTYLKVLPKVDQLGER